MNTCIEHSLSRQTREEIAHEIAAFRLAERTRKSGKPRPKWSLDPILRRKGGKEAILERA